MSQPAISRRSTDLEPLNRLRENLAITIAEALEDDEVEGRDLKGVGDYVAEKILEGSVIHVDVCPECSMPLHGHSLDPPPHHPCEIDPERFVAAAFVGEVQ